MYKYWIKKSQWELILILLLVRHCIHVVLMDYVLPERTSYIINRELYVSHIQNISDWNGFTSKYSR